MSEFQYEKGDKVIINCEPSEDPQDLWSYDFKSYIGTAGVVSSVYDRSDENEDYDILNVAFHYNGDKYEYMFYAASLRPHTESLTTGSYVRIIRRHTKGQGDLHWADSMDELLGSYGRVMDVSKRPNEKSYIYKVQTEYGGRKQLFYYYLHSLMHCVEEKTEEKSTKKWMLSEDGTIVFKIARVLPDKSLTLVDKIGRQFESTKLRLIDAPPECKGFEYVKDQPEYFRI